MKKLTASLMLICLLVLSACGGAPSNTVHSLDDLKGKKIGVQLKTTGDVYSSDIEGATVMRYNKGEDAVLALRDGEVDAVMLDDAPANVFVKKYDHLRILDEPYADEEYGIAFNKKDTKLLADINQALDKLKRTGVIDKIDQAWKKGETNTTAYEGQKKEQYKNGTLVMATNAEFPPYESFTKDHNKIIGIDVDILKAVCDELDMKLDVQHTSFDSIFASVDRGMADVGVAAITITEERLEKFNFSQPYLSAKQVIIVRED